MHFAGSVPDFICLPADCCVADDSSVFEEEESTNCSDSEHSFCLDLKSISESNDTYNDNSVQKIKIVYDDDSYIFSNDTATTVAATFSDSSVGNASIESEECFQNQVEQPVFNFKGPKVMPTRHETPVTICTANTIGTLRSRRIFRVLLDTGSSCSLIKRACLPKNCQMKTLEARKRVSTLAGKLQAQEVVTMRDIRLPEFDKNRRIDQQKCLVFDNDNCNYDIILGTNFLSKAGIKLNYEDETMEWFDTTLPLRPTGVGLKAEDFDAMVDSFHIQVENELFGEDWLQSFAIAMLDAKYEFTQVRDVVDQLSHLNMHQKADLLQVLQKHQKMFDGTLGVYPHKKFHIDIDPDAKPVHARAYPVPRVHLRTFKKELDHLVELGVLAPQGSSEWASPTFITPKKDGRVRWVSDLRELNKVVKRKVYPLPIITDILRKRKGYKFLPNWISVCSTTHLNLTRKVKTCVQSLLHLASTSIFVCQWA